MEKGLGQPHTTNKVLEEPDVSDGRAIRTFIRLRR